MTDRRDSSNAQGSSFLQGALNVNISGGTMVGTQNFNNTGNPLNLLYSKVAHNAILNAGGRADEVKCHPGTRIEVLSKTKRWRDEGPERIFWLSGPAGAGKSAIIQTFAENYITSAIIMINFFFFRSDSTRNHISPIVATLVFQLLEFYPGAESHISAVLTKMPYIFKKSIPDQFLYLIINPINYLRNLHNDWRPIVLLIDGLDECDMEKSQATLVRILDDLVTTTGSPFKVLISSRKEPHLTMAFNQTQSTIGSIFLDDEYQPEADIRRYVTDELAAIKRTHHLGHTLTFDWPSQQNIEDIVQKSSGQFIYAATVVRFISSSPPSPKHSLDQIKGIRPAKRNSPFTALDAVYTHILSQADDWDTLKDILSAQIIINGKIGWILGETIHPLGFTVDDITSHTATLGALMQFGGGNIIFYHASLGDFLKDPTRSGDLFLDIPTFTADLLAAHFSNKVHDDEFDLLVTLAIAAMATVSSPALENALAAFSPQHLPFRLEGYGPYCRNFLHMLHRVYSESNEHFYEALLRKWLLYFHKSNMTADQLKLDEIKLGLEIWAEITRELPQSEAGLLKTAQTETVQSEAAQTSETVQSEAAQSSKKRHKVARVFKGLFKTSPDRPT